MLSRAKINGYATWLIVPIWNRQVYIQLFILQTIGDVFFASSRQEEDDTM